MEVELILGQVNPAALEVFPDVADEVCELEGQAQRAGGPVGLGDERLQNRQHHLPDDGGRALHVTVAQLVPASPGGLV